ncbi:MAG: SdpI family protein, partial [Rudanella sp.]|nr:SdpI family protein [Rudanella sp.]
LIMAGLQVLLYALLRFVPGAGVFSNNQTSNYNRHRLVVTLYLSGVVAWNIYTATQPGMVQNTTPILLMAMALLAAIGNYITTVRPNFFVGIRTPWTLFSETVWRKTHQLTGRVWVGGSILGTILLLLVPTAWQVPVLLTVVGVLVIIPTVYSYVVFRQEKRRVA